MLSNFAVTLTDVFALWFIVSRECNFTMPLTSFTIGGFTQPMTASSIQCQSGSAEKGLSTRFLWVSPEPVFQSLDELGEVDEIFFDDYGN